jgi:hypothetical protein
VGQKTGENCFITRSLDDPAMKIVFIAGFSPYKQLAEKRSFTIGSGIEPAVEMVCYKTPLVPSSSSLPPISTFLPLAPTFLSPLLDPFSTNLLM